MIEDKPAPERITRRVADGQAVLPKGLRVLSMSRRL